MNDKTPVGYEKEFTEPYFWAKVKGFAILAGKEVIGKALQLFYALKAPGTPAWAQSIILGALGYFITTLDAVPDITPIVGFTDDLGVLTLALAAVAAHITPAIKQKASDKLNEWFGDSDAKP